MDATQPKGKSVGAITIHFNEKLRVSHVEITGRGDLVSRRTVQDSIMLVFRAMAQHRSSRKRSGGLAADEVAKAESRDSSRLQAYREKSRKRKEEADQQLLQLVLDRKKMVAEAEEKSRTIINPEFFPESPLGQNAKEAAKKAAEAEAEKILASMLGSKETKAAPTSEKKSKSTPQGSKTPGKKPETVKKEAS